MLLARRPAHLVSDPEVAEGEIRGSVAVHHDTPKDHRGATEGSIV